MLFRKIVAFNASNRKEQIQQLREQNSTVSNGYKSDYSTILYRLSQNIVPQGL
jgi:hypothetical protein